VAAGGEKVYVAETELEAGALGFWGNMVQAITHIAPGLNVLLGLAFIVSFAAISAPFVYLMGGFICLLVAIVLTQLARSSRGRAGTSSTSARRSARASAG
jgi:amino acid transporter